jgi:prepilin-type N-terminal cleavage/methylation domain-containing protein
VSGVTARIRKHPHPFASEDGFSLAELLVVAAVVGMLMAGITTLYRQGVEAYVAGSNRVETQQNARVTIELMARELRTARSVTTVTSATNLTFVNQDGVTIQYALSGTTLNRTQAGVTRVLSGGVESLSITCFSAFDVSTGTYTTTTTPAQVRVIRLEVRTRTEETTGGSNATNQHASMQSTVTLRSAI